MVVASGTKARAEVCSGGVSKGYDRICRLQRGRRGLLKAATPGPQMVSARAVGASGGSEGAARASRGNDGSGGC